MLATESQAHAEWHRNSGIPMGLPGCPQDACHTDHMDPSEVRRLVRQREVNFAFIRGEEGTATIECAHCHGIHLAVRYVRECSGVTTQVPAEVEPTWTRPQADADADDAREEAISRGEDRAYWKRWG